MIAILAAMLLPALNQARQKAHDIKCTSNLKQLGTYMAMYIDQSDGRIPSPNTNLGGDGYSGKWQDMLMQLYAPSIPQEDYCFVDSDKNDLPRGPFACPSSEAHNRQEGSFHYAINSGGYASGLKGASPQMMTITQIKSPSQRAALMDINYTRKWMNPSAESRDELKSTDREWRHQGRTESTSALRTAIANPATSARFRPRAAITRKNISGTPARTTDGTLSGRFFSNRPPDFRRTVFSLTIF